MICHDLTFMIKFSQMNLEVYFFQGSYIDTIIPAFFFVSYK